MSEPVIAYKGEDRNGIPRGGQATGIPADLIRRLFNDRWLWAIAECDGIQVGGIGFNEELQRNVWWGEGRE